MDVTLQNAVQAYQQRLQSWDDAASGNTDAEAPAGSSGGSSFSDMVHEALTHAADTVQRSETMRVDALSGGKVELSDLITAVSEAELTVSTVVAIRDRVISAYQEILRMPI